MKVAVIGATGKSGQHIVTEALNKGYEVTAIVRDKTKITHDKVKVLERNIFDLTVNDIKGFDAVINAFSAPQNDQHQHVVAMQHLIKIFEQVPQVRLLVVGGAGSLYVDPQKSVRLSSTPDFPDAYKPTALNMAESFDLLKVSKVNWTYFSPAAFYDPDGKRTGKYQLGTDFLMTNKEGQSYISYADYAIAMVAELANKAFIKKRFTIVAA
ncbi:NAD(P)-dependent oxidoreductase [Zophobihabitans entericus]|uniref:NAD(P)-dependent oxidoreductase n=1 Tax=Zophobihabitans entericus TaxID=1635327 RepID=A0A6G9IE33_9GAMM|nr:NAD(P)-dependent oxidoreductase [Zophobihabitans entericus]QIQ22087.1 NAD(P)-dependent oxidoreductase [Zophobihabitans entericus]